MFKRLLLSLLLSFAMVVSTSDVVIAAKPPNSATPTVTSSSAPDESPLPTLIAFSDNTVVEAIDLPLDASSGLDYNSQNAYLANLNTVRTIFVVIGILMLCGMGFITIKLSLKKARLSREREARAAAAAKEAGLEAGNITPVETATDN